MGNWVTKTVFCLTMIGLAVAVPAVTYPNPQWEWHETILLTGGGTAFLAGLVLLGLTGTLRRQI